MTVGDGALNKRVAFSSWEAFKRTAHFPTWATLEVPKLRQAAPQGWHRLSPWHLQPHARLT